METSSTLPLARYAEALAHVVHFGLPAQQEVLARLDVAEAWDGAEQTWSARLVSDGPETQRAFATTFAATRKRLAAETPALASIGTLPVPAPPEPIAEAPVPVGDRPAADDLPRVTKGAAMAPDVPTYLAAVPTVPAALLDLRGTVEGADVPCGPALPFLVSAGDDPERDVRNALAHGELVQGPRMPVARRRAAHPLAGTLDAAGAPQGPALPFVGANGPPTGVGAPYQPPLTLQQYASLCVDLEADYVVDVLRQYRLSPEQKAALDTHYQRLFAERPSERLAFGGARKTYAAWRQTAKSGR
jgi:hypothetical protein